MSAKTAATGKLLGGFVSLPQVENLLQQWLEGQAVFDRQVQLQTLDNHLLVENQHVEGLALVGYFF